MSQPYNILPCILDSESGGVCIQGEGNVIIDSYNASFLPKACTVKERGVPSLLPKRHAPLPKSHATLSYEEQIREERRLAKRAAYRRYHRHKRQWWLLPFALLFVLPFAGLLGLPKAVLMLGFIGTFILAIGKTWHVDA